MLAAMEITATYTFDAPRQRVWELLIDPTVIAGCLPGCESMEPTGDDTYTATLTVGIAAITGRYSGTVQMADKVPPASYTLQVEGEASLGSSTDPPKYRWQRTGERHDDGRRHWQGAGRRHDRAGRPTAPRQRVEDDDGSLLCLSAGTREGGRLAARAEGVRVNVDLVTPTLRNIVAGVVAIAGFAGAVIVVLVVAFDCASSRLVAGFPSSSRSATRTIISPRSKRAARSHAHMHQHRGGRTKAVGPPTPSVNTTTGTAPCRRRGSGDTGGVLDRFRGPNRDGRYAEMAIRTDWPGTGLEPLWNQPIGGGYASFVVAEGRAFTIEQRRRREVVAAYDVETGRELWTHAGTRTSKKRWAARGRAPRRRGTRDASTRWAPPGRCGVSTPTQVPWCGNGTSLLMVTRRTSHGRCQRRLSSSTRWWSSFPAAATRGRSPPTTD